MGEYSSCASSGGRRGRGRGRGRRSRRSKRTRRIRKRSRQIQRIRTSRLTRRIRQERRQYMHGGNPIYDRVKDMFTGADTTMTGATNKLGDTLSSASKIALEQVQSSGKLLATKLEESKATGKAKIHELSESTTKSTDDVLGSVGSVITNIRAKVSGSTPT